MPNTTCTCFTAYNLNIKIICNTDLADINVAQSTSTDNGNYNIILKVCLHSHHIFGLKTLRLPNSARF